MLDLENEPTFNFVLDKAEPRRRVLTHLNETLISDPRALLDTRTFRFK
jgi:hypothetical protein